MRLDQGRITSKHQRVLTLLKERMDDGRFPPGCRLPPETVLHKQLRVGRQTLLRALEELVREGRIVRRRGSGTYVAQRARPPLWAGRHLKLGLLWPHSVFRARYEDSFVAAMTRGALERWGLPAEDVRFPEAGRNEPTFGIWSCPQRGVTVEAVGEALSVAHRRPPLEAVRAGGYDGVLSLGIVEEGWLERLLALGIPTVIVDFPGEGLAGRADLVFVDAMPGYRRAVAHLAARGLRRIHFMGGLIGSGPAPAGLKGEALYQYRRTHARPDPDSLLRQAAWRLAMDEHGLSVGPGWVHASVQAAHRIRPEAERLAALPEAERPQALVCASAMQAEVCREVFAAHGLVLETAGAAPPAYQGPALAVRIDGKDVGAAAASLLLSRLQQPDSPFLRVGVAMRFSPPPVTEIIKEKESACAT